MRQLIGITLICILCISVSLSSAEVVGNDKDEVRKITEPILDNILEGFSENDYQMYCRDFDDTLKEAVSEKKFIDTDSQIEHSIGNCVSREYLGFLNKGRMTVVLWKGRFDKAEDDVLIKLVVSKRNGRYLVTGLWFN
jgi:hypothetical protein